MLMKVFPVTGIVALGLAMWLAASDTYAQRAARPTLRLPERTLGRAGTAPEAPEQVGTLEGTERFIRGNRSVEDFVGADVQDVQEFVGQQGVDVTQDVRTAVEDLRPVRERNLNVPVRPEGRRGLYRPRLRIAFAFPRPSGDVVGERITQELQLIDRLRLPSPISVSVEDGTAILRGVVTSSHDREMIARLVSFEPGIVRVRNELQIQSTATPKPGDAQSR